MQTVYQFKVPGTIMYGMGAVKSVGDAGKKFGNRALLVTDNVLAKLGLLSDVTAGLDRAGIGYAIYDGVVSEPTLAYVNDGFAMYKKSNAEFLVAVGGGSPIDTAKAISALATNSGKMTDFEGVNKIPLPGAPLIAIPTTAGTGSEVTQTTIITDTDRNVKMLTISPNIMPRVAIVDPEMTIGMPPAITAATGLDALTHAIEAYVSVKAQPLTDILAIEAIKLISANLRPAWSNGNNMFARSAMMLGSLKAGMAFSNSSVALVHGMARPIGAYFHVPHGISNAALLAAVVEFSISGNPKRYADIAASMGEICSGLSVLDAAGLAAKAVKRLNNDLKIPSLRGLGVDEDKFRLVVKQMALDAIASGSPAHNPRKASQEEIVDLYYASF